MFKIEHIINLYLSLKRIFIFKSHDVSTDIGISDERYRRIFLTAGSSLIVKIVSVSINLITVPLTLNYLGAERYGLWMSISSIMTLMSFADLGLGNGLLNAVSKSKGLNDHDSAIEAVSSTFYILLIISIILLVIFSIIYPFIPWYKLFNVVSVKAKSEAGLTIVILVLSLLINMPLGIIQRIQEGNQEGYMFQLYQIFGSVFSFIALLLCVKLEIGLPGLVLSYSAGTLIALIINGYVIFTRKYDYLVPRIRNFNFSRSKLLINAGLVFFILNIFSLLASTSDNIIIAHVIGATKIASFEIIKKIFLFSMLTQFLIQPLWPAFNEAMAKGDMVWVSKTLKKALNLSIGFGALISLPLLIFGKQIICYWVGKEYEPSWLLLVGFYLFVFQANYGGVMSTLLNSSKYINKQIVFIGLASTCSILLKIVLGRLIGIEGIIWGTLIAYSIFYVYPTWRIAKGLINGSSRQ
jgi:O-antigen/teichoic acid export membrane protein